MRVVVIDPAHRIATAHLHSRVIDRGMQFDHVRTGHDFIQDRKRGWDLRIRRGLTLLLLSQSNFHLNFTQALDQRLYTSSTQRLDQLVGRCFVSVRQ